MGARAVSIEDHIADVYDAAVAYVGARVNLENTSGRDVLTIQVDVDRLWHELAFYVLSECRYCDPGTCPFEEA